MDLARRRACLATGGLVVAAHVFVALVWVSVSGKSAGAPPVESSIIIAVLASYFLLGFLAPVRWAAILASPILLLGFLAAEAAQLQGCGSAEACGWVEFTVWFWGVLSALAAGAALVGAGAQSAWKWIQARRAA